MQLLINKEANLSLAERRFAQWVEWSPAQPGVAVLNAGVPHRGTIHQVDALIWTPQRCITVEIKGFRSRQDGTLVVHPNGPLRMDDGRIADLYGNDEKHDPVDQVRNNTLVTKDWTTRNTNRSFFINGLALIMLVEEQDVPALRAPAIPPGIDIIVEDFDVFRYYLDRPATAEPVIWDSRSVGDLIDDLGLSHLYRDRRELATAFGEAMEQSSSDA